VTSEESSVFPNGRRIIYTNWGRSAVEVVLRSEGLEGGTVMLPAFICQESFEPLFDRLDITPLFVDVEADTYQIDPRRAIELAPRADAAIVVHPFGFPADMDVWTDVSAEYGMPLIEDCVRALGAKYDGRAVGSFGTHAIYSLHKVSPVSIGGAIATDSRTPDTFLDEPTYDARALYHLLPEEWREDLSVSYPREYECRYIDEITRREFQRFLDDKIDAYMQANRKKANRLRSGLERLGFDVQADAPERSHYIVASTVPDRIDRDELLGYLYENLDPSPAKVVWANPWVKSYAPERFQDKYPQTKKLADDIICFSIGSTDDVGALVDRIEEFRTAYG